jgi:uncharacterized protein
LSKLIDCPGSSVDFHADVDLHELAFGGCCPVVEPVRASGSVRNTAGVLLMDGTVTTMLHGVCDRCARDFERRVSFPIHAVLVTELASEQDADQWTFLLQNDCADLDEIVTTTFVLNMDSKLLCKDDCKGLCCRCGKNLNEGDCDCQPETDPRLAVLKQLLKDKK